MELEADSSGLTGEGRVESGEVEWIRRAESSGVGSLQWSPPPTPMESPPSRVEFASKVHSTSGGLHSTSRGLQWTCARLQWTSAQLHWSARVERCILHPASSVRTPPPPPAARRDRRCPRPAPAARLRRPHCPCACPPPPHSPRASPCRACRPRSSRPTFSLSRAELITHRPRLPRRFRMKGQADPPTNLCASSWRRRPRPSRDAQVRAAPRAVPTFLRVSFIALAPSCDV